jgi:Adenine/guanine phosphoribosyltransferases and related PRPP-binding proteins
MEELRRYIRDIPGFPKEGIIFHDITPLLQNGKAFRRAVDAMAETMEGKGVEYLIGVEARGFIFASALAYKLGAGLVIVRKLGKLPYEKNKRVLRPGIRKRRARNAQRRDCRGEQSGLGG